MNKYIVAQKRTCTSAWFKIALALVAMAQSEVLRCPHRLDTSRQGNIHKALALSSLCALSY
ncbi:hypothetical protein IGI04_000621 [Brassica rapa subsp. trilocularis]|uniref:Uncharacterized protein n=1 Tax=Brassica rapa subsp. trilocularis TaxID=1813537 RepID=A0ABQ7NTM9_BRACM|nr:hypothetical protein IGI04_000621 [Brassica rapa subsp. trilocularis]